MLSRLFQFYRSQRRTGNLGNEICCIGSIALIVTVSLHNYIGVRFADNRKLIGIRSLDSKRYLCGSRIGERVGKRLLLRISRSKGFRFGRNRNRRYRSILLNITKHDIQLRIRGIVTQRKTGSLNDISGNQTRVIRIQTVCECNGFTRNAGNRDRVGFVIRIRGINIKNSYYLDIFVNRISNICINSSRIEIDRCRQLQRRSSTYRNIEIRELIKTVTESAGTL